MSLKNNYPTIMPSLALDFVNCPVLSPRITFSRSTKATRVNSLGLIETVAVNQPRFDYDPVTLAPKGLLIEESRTNLALNSNTFNTGFGTTATLNATISPDGTQNASLITEDTATGEHYALDRTIAITAGSTYTWSFYAKQGVGNRKIMLRVATAASASVVFDLTTGTPSPATATNLVSYDFQQLSNGWWKFWIVFTGASTANCVCRAQMFNVETGTLYTGDGVSGVYIWGAQVEQGAFPTSYIPTTSTPLPRGTDNASMTGTSFSSWYNQSEGTIYSNWITGGGLLGVNVYNINDTTGTNVIRNRYNSAGSDNDNAVIVANSVQATLSGSVNQITPYTVYKNAMAYKLNDFVRSASGILITDTSGTLPSVVQMNIGSAVSSGYLNGHIQSIKYYPQRLSNTQLQTLTNP